MNIITTVSFDKNSSLIKVPVTIKKGNEILEYKFAPLASSTLRLCVKKTNHKGTQRFRLLNLLKLLLSLPKLLLSLPKLLLSLPKYTKAHKEKSIK